MVNDSVFSLDFISSCSNPSFFIHKVLGYKPSFFHEIMLNEAMKNRYLLIEVPRGHAKTTMISKGYITWLLWKEKNIEICLTSSSLRQSKKILSEIKSELSSNSFLKHLVPNDSDFSWNKEEIKTINGNYLYLRAFNDSARGMQPNYIIYDDILRTEDSNTTAEEKEEIFWSIFFPAGQTNRCKHFIVGTPIYEGDLFDKISENAEKIGDWKHVHFSCVKTDSHGNWIEPLWKERYSLEELKKIQSMMSPILFAREYLCDPASSGGDIYDKAKLALSLDHDLNFSFDTKEGLTIIGLDIAFSKSETADWSVITVLTLKNEPHTITQFLGDTKSTRIIENPILINRIVRRKSIDIQQLVDLYSSVGASRIVIDKSTGGVLVGKDLRNAGLNVDEQDFGPTNRQSMLLNLSKIIDSERLVIPFKDPSTQTIVEVLLKELRGMQLGMTKMGSQNIVSTTKHDDCVMSLALALKPIQTISKSDAKLVFSQNISDSNNYSFFKNNSSDSNYSEFFKKKTKKIPGL